MRAVVVLSIAAIAGSGFSQGAPKDVPKNHWAFDAVDQMFKLGLLVGYPNGNFNGDRPASRFELAESFSQLERAEEKMVQSLAPLQLRGYDRAQVVGLGENLRSLKKEVDSLQRRQDDLKALKDALDSLRSNLDDMKKSAADLRAQLSKSH